MCKCKRCGRVLKSPESIERGYGKTCYRIVQFQESTKPEVKTEINQEIAFLKLEIKTLKRMFKQIQIKGTIEPIERIKRDDHRPERDSNKGNFAGVMKEMKSIFKLQENFHYTNILKPEIRECIESPPILA
jgi:hypothetical protein